MEFTEAIERISFGLKTLVSVSVAAAVFSAVGGEWHGNVWKDSFESASDWPERRAYPSDRSVSFDFASRCPEFASSLFVAGSVTGKCDTAWHVQSARVALPYTASRYAVSFSLSGSERHRCPATSGAWRTCVVWFGNDGEVLTRAVLPTTVLAGTFGRIRAVDAVPPGAAAFAIQFGWDAPNVCQGRTYRLADVRFELLPDSAECGIEMPDIKSPKIVRTSESPVSDPSKPFRFKAIDDAVDWDTLKVSADGEDLLALCRRIGDEVAVHPKGGTWRSGITRLKISVADNDGNMSDSKKVHFVGEAPKAPAVGVREDGMMTIGGKPFFSIGIYGFRRRAINGNDCDRGLRELAEAGFNTVQSYGIARDPEFLAAAAKHGFRMWAAPPSFDRDADWSFAADQSVVTWYIGDDTSQHLTPQDLADRDDNIRAVDPVRPTCQADAMRSDADVDNYENYAEFTDGFLAEIYPVHSANPAKDRHCVAATIRDMKRTMRDNAKNGGGRRHFAWPTIQYFKGWGWGRFPMRDELFGMSFAAIVHGAHGINWYTYGGSDGPVVDGKDSRGRKYNYGVCWNAETWGNITNLASRIARLRPALETPVGPQPSAPVLLDGPQKDACGHCAVSQLLKSADGFSYLICVNSADARVKARFSSGLRGEAEVLWENRRVKPDADGSFIDDFEPLGVHVYRFRRKTGGEDGR